MYEPPVICKTVSPVVSLDAYSLARRKLFSATPVASARAFESTASPVNKERDAVKVRPKAMVSAILGEIALPDAKCEH